MHSGPAYFGLYITDLTHRMYRNIIYNVYKLGVQALFAVQ